MLLPVLHITTPGVSCLVMVNGTVAGESSSMPVVPVSPEGKAYITCFPLHNEGSVVALPLTLSLSFQSGRLSSPISNGIAHISPQGGVYLSLEPAVLPLETQPANPYAVSRANFTYNRRQYTATAYYESGLRIAIDNRSADALDVLHTPKDLTDCTLNVVSCFSEADVFLFGEGPKGKRLLVYTPTPRGYRPVIDEYAAGAITGEKVQCVRDLGDSCRHQARYTIHMEDDAFIKSEEEYGYFSSAKREPISPNMLCQAFCDTVKLGLLDEAAECITPALAEGLDMEDLQDFLGDFTHTYMLGGESPDNELWLAYPLLDNCYSIKLFRFEIENDKIANIFEG